MTATPPRPSQPAQGTPRPALDPSQMDPPFVLPPTVELRTGIVYARPAGQALQLDLFVPKKRPQTRIPWMVYIHGGGWRGGSPRQFWRHAAHFASLGWPGITVAYRLAPAHRFPAQLEDVQAAVRWLRAQGAELGVDPQRIGAAGGSAGGHLAALLGTTDAVVDGISSRVQAVVAFNGVFDLPALDSERAAGPRSALLGDDPRLAIEASPLHQASSQAAPALLLHGTADETIPFQQAVAFQRRLREYGVRAELYAADGAAHGFFNRPPWYRPTLERMERFLLDVFGPAGSR